MDLRPRRTPPPTARRSRHAREGFLRVETPDLSGVREAILASWWRSRDANVAADRLELQYVRDPNLDTPLTRSAEPVLRHLREQLDGQSVSIVLTDPAGVVLSRLTADAALERHLDRVNLAPGFSYAEAVVGTNGIGTALEAGRPMHVFGHEHYAENLEQLACAGVPIRHPMSGKTVGVLDLTCWRARRRTAARDARQDDRRADPPGAAHRDRHARDRAAPRLHAGLPAQHRHGVRAEQRRRDDERDRAHDARRRRPDRRCCGTPPRPWPSAATRRPSSCPSGMQVRLHTRPVQADGRVAGGVVDVRVVEPIGTRRPARPARQPMLLPGLVGAGPLWRRACTEAEKVYRSGSWLIVEGEPGSGKAALLQALHQRVNPAAAAQRPGAGGRRRRRLGHAGAADAGGEGRHDRPAPPRAAARVGPAGADRGAAGRRRRGGAAWVAVTVPPTPPGPELTRLLRLFHSTVRLPPLRHHVEDVELLVPLPAHAPRPRRAADRVSGGACSCCCASTGRATSSSCWQTLRTVAAPPPDRRGAAERPAARRSSRVAPAPAHARSSRWSATRSCSRCRTPAGNKARAARALGHVPRDDLPQDPRVRHRRRRRPGRRPRSAQPPPGGPPDLTGPPTGQCPSGCGGWPAVSRKRSRQDTCGGSGRGARNQPERRHASASGPVSSHSGRASSSGSGQAVEPR